MIYDSTKDSSPSVTTDFAAWYKNGRPNGCFCLWANFNIDLIQPCYSIRARGHGPVVYLVKMLSLPSSETGSSAVRSTGIAIQEGIQ